MNFTKNSEKKVIVYDKYEYPKSWRKSRLKYELKFIKGFEPKEEQLGTESDGIKFLKVADVSSGRETNVFLIQDLDQPIIRPEDLFIVLDGSPGVVGKGQEGYFSGGIRKIVIPPTINQSYLSFLLKSSALQHIIGVYSYGEIIKHASESINYYTVYLPSIQEQEMISSYLDKEISRVDALIKKYQDSINLLQEKRITLITNAVTKGLNTKAKMKDSGFEWIGDVPAHWEVKKIRRICKVNQGLQIAQSERFAEPGENRFIYITIKFLNASESDQISEYIENPPKSVVCNKDDVLIARTGATGEIITGQEGVFHNNFFKAEFDRNRICKDYFIYYLKSKPIRELLLLKAGVTTIPDLNHNEFLSTDIVYPKDMNEQLEIVKFINYSCKKIDDLSEKIKQQIEYLNEYKVSLISDAVTGKIDIRGAV